MSLSRLPAADALRPLYERELTAALRAMHRTDKEALHDWRVSLRRLRVLVKAFAQPGKERKRVLRPMARLQKKSNRGRDVQVMLAWLAAEWPRLDERELAGAAKWQCVLQRAQHHHRLRPKLNAAALQALVPPFASLLPVAGALGEVAAQRLEKQLEMLRVLLVSPNESVPLHPLRLRVKSVRYLLLPFCEEASGCAKAESLLHQLQDRLGEWHDGVLRQQSLTAMLRREMKQLSVRMWLVKNAPGAMELVEAAPSLPGLMALARRNTAEQQRMDARIARHLHDGGAELLQSLQDAVTELRAQAAAVRLP